MLLPLFIPECKTNLVSGGGRFKICLTGIEENAREMVKVSRIEAFRQDAMANVFIYPVEDETAKAHYRAAVEKGVELQIVSPWIRDEAQIAGLSRCYPDGTCYVWGVPDRGDNRSTWNAMSEDDLVLGYRNRSIVSAATVLMKVDNPSLATALWGNHTRRAASIDQLFQ